MAPASEAILIGRHSDRVLNALTVLSSCDARLIFQSSENDQRLESVIEISPFVTPTSCNIINDMQQTFTFVYSCGHTLPVSVRLTEYIFLPLYLYTPTDRIEVS